MRGNSERWKRVNGVEEGLGSERAKGKRCLACASHPEAVLERQNPFDISV